MKLGKLIKLIRAVELKEADIKAMHAILSSLQISDYSEQKEIDALKQEKDEAENDLNYLNEEEI